MTLFTKSYTISPVLNLLHTSNFLSHHHQPLTSKPLSSVTFSFATSRHLDCRNSLPFYKQLPSLPSFKQQTKTLFFTKYLKDTASVANLLILYFEYFTCVYHTSAILVVAVVGVLWHPVFKLYLLTSFFYLTFVNVLAGNNKMK